MNVYVDIADSGKTVTYKEEYGKRQYLYVHDNEGFIFKDLADYAKRVRKEVCDEIKEQICMLAYKSNSDENFMFNDNVKFNKVLAILDQIQGE